MPAIQSQSRAVAPQARQQVPAEHLTKLGRVDRRFKGHREDPAANDVINPDYIHPRTGGMVGTVHITKDGRPDRRFLENRGKSTDQIMKEWAANVMSGQIGEDGREGFFTLTDEEPAE